MNIAIAPPVPGKAGPALVNIGSDCYLTFLGADGNPTGNYAARVENVGTESAPSLRLLRTNDPAPEFARAADGKIEVADV